MHLTTFSDLGLRVLMILGDVPPGEQLTIRQLSDAVNASNNHLSKVVAKLAELNLVVSVRGRNGGVLLAEGTRDVPVGKILRQLEGPGEVVECGGSKPCPLMYRDCQLRHRLAAAREAFFVELDKDTIGELISQTQPAPAGSVGIGLPSVRPAD